MRSFIVRNAFVQSMRRFNDKCMNTATASFTKYKGSRRKGLYMAVPGALAMILYYNNNDVDYLKEMVMSNLVFINTAVADDTNTASAQVEPRYTLKEVSEHNTLESGL